MTAASATLSNYRQAPRKVRLIADLVRGKTAAHALNLLANLPKRGSEPFAKLIKSAVANAKVPATDLYISKIQVGGGVVFRRQMPRARGRASLIKKKTSHIKLEVAARPAKKTSEKAPEKAPATAK